MHRERSLTHTPRRVAISLAAAAIAVGLGVACSTRLGDPAPVSAEGRPCASDRDCPQPKNPCQVWTCWQEVCTPVAAARETVLPAEAQKSGDCKLLVCDGQGKAASIPDKSDLPPEDDNPCAEEVCEEGEPAFPPVAVGAPCGKNGVCNGHGKCGGCLPEAKRCNGNMPETCSEEGEWENHGPCPEVTPVCGGNACLGILSIAAGDGFTCASLAGGKARCFGDPSSGKLGNEGVSRVTGLTGVTQVSAGGRHTCALLADQTVRCWGDNSSGQLGDATTGARGVPAPVPALEKVAQISSGYLFSCARLSDGTVACWGDNEYGQIGVTAAPSKKAAGVMRARAELASDRPVEVKGLDGVAQLSLGAEHACALLVNGMVACWGSPEDALLGRGGAPPSPPKKPAKPPKAIAPLKGLRDVVEIAAGAEHACARLADATVACWGRNHHGQLGDGTTKNTAAPVKVKGLTGALGLALGDDHSCAVLADGKVVCWGAGASHANGDASGADHPEPVPVAGLSGVVFLASGADHLCAGLSNRTFLCWGGNRYGQLGSGATGEKPSAIVF